MNVRIAGLPLALAPELAGHCALFREESGNEPVITIDREPLAQCHGVGFVSIPAAHVLQQDKELLTANEDWSRAVVHCRSYHDPFYVLPLAAICARFARFDAVLLHGSFVDFEGEGIVFAGPSGIGKTTQAQLWSEHLGADIVNGDKVFLRCHDDRILAHGLPWKGSSPYCLNRSVPVRGIVALRQSGENRIRRLTSLECMEYFLPHIFLPHWDPGCAERALETIDRIITQIPVWLLECRPDRDAVLLTKQTVLG